MAADSRPRARKRSWFPVLALGPPFLAVLLVFVPNPLTDRAASLACRALFGKPVVFRQVRFNYRPRQGALYLSVEQIDLRALCGGPDSATCSFVRRHGLSDWLLLRDSRWVLTRQGETLFLRLLDSRSGESTLKGGVRMESGRLSKMDAALWLPKAVWERFPDLVEKRFAEDAQGRRLFKLTWSGGRWRLWGRSAPVLEASWR